MDQSLEQRPDIVIWDATLDTLEMAALYRSVDAFVLASRGEGWGRPYMEAMSCGLPTIGTRGSGNDDFMTESNSFLVPTTLVEVPDEAAAEIPVYREHRWLEPNVAELRSALRRVATDQSAREAVACRGAADIRAGFSLQQACESVENNLRAVEDRFRCRAPAAVQASQVCVELEGELFAGHSFSNVNEAVSLRLMRHPSIGLSLRRVRLNPTFDSEAFHAHELRPYVGRVLPDGPQVTIRHAFPPNWTPPERGRWVHIQPWEYGALPLDWVRPLRDQVDEIWAPSNYVKRVYERSGIPSDKVHVIPWGVDTDVFGPDAPSLLMPTNRRFKFLFVGGTIGRKGFDLVLDAYLSGFTRQDDVCLVVKDMGTKSFYRYGNYRQRILEAMSSGSAPEIVYIDRNLSPGQLASLYTACECLVAPYRGEGFGLPILEAMACGLPAIVPRGGASDDFVTDETGYRLAAEEVECHHDWRLCGVPTELSISVDAVRAAMRNAYKHPQQNRRKGQLASAWVRQRFTWEKTAQTMAERLIALANSPPLPVADQTPESGRDLPAPTPTLTVCMLCHNDEKTIGDSLGRVRPYVREVIVLDLGSTDRSTKIAAEYGARVYCGQLSDDFGSLRNAMLARATSDWVLAVDADEVLGERELLKIMALTTSMPGDVSGVRVRVRDPEGQVDDDSNGAEVRLFRNHHEIVYSFRACEQVETSILRFGGRILASDIVLTRAGVRTRAPACYRCPQTRLELLHRDHAEHPDHPTVLFNLGQARFGEGDFFHAECYLNDCLQRSKPNDFHYRAAACLLIDSHLRKGDPYRATEVAQYVLKQAPDDAELHSAVARLANSIGERV